MTVHIHMVFDDPIEGHTVAAELLRRFPANTDVDTVSDDDAADDIDLIHQVATIIATAESPAAAEVALHDLIPLWGKSNAAMQFIDQAIDALPSSDDAPPHGIPRPSHLEQAIASAETGRPFVPMMRPRANGASEAELMAKFAAHDIVDCPSCGAERGKWCRSKSTESWGAGMMHAARIDCIDWERPV